MALATNISNRNDLLYFLAATDQAVDAGLFTYADTVRRQCMGEGILLRGIIEFSNICTQKCDYCGLNRNNTKLERYRMSRDEILASIADIVSHNIRTVVLQSGEDDGIESAWLAELVRTIKERFQIAVTLSVGERPRSDYALWRTAGADRYLLKIETTNESLYRALHAGRDIINRLRCLDDLRDLGYQVGCGNMVGLPGQTLEMITDDILFFQRKDFDMIGIGPFIPHPQTPLAAHAPGTATLALKTLALTRIMTRNAHLPATTALGSLGADFRLDALKAGANVLMPNFTPTQYRRLYEIYPHKRCVSEAVGACASCMESFARATGRTIDYSVGDSRKR